jgi:hypothetical protein
MYKIFEKKEKNYKTISIKKEIQKSAIIIRFLESQKKKDNFKTKFHDTNQTPDDNN